MGLLFVILPQLPDSIATPALTTPAFRTACVLFCVFVAVRAMRFSILDLCGFLCSWARAYASTKINFSSDRLKVRGVATPSMRARFASGAILRLMARVVNVKSFRNMADECNVSEAMGKHPSGLDKPESLRDRHQSVSGFTDLPLPYPATGLRIFNVFFFESFDRRPRLFPRCHVSIFPRFAARGTA
jgi:hypothetical protein